jgi:two-component system sensor histidine kinase KdpD
MASTDRRTDVPDGRPDRGRPSDAARQRRVAEAISHHLRTPLTIVRSGLAILDESATPLTADERREVMDDVRQETERLVSVVDDLLTILTPSDRSIRTEPILLQRFLPSVLLGGSSPTDIRSVDLDVPDGLPPVSGDPESVAHVVADLATAAASADRAGAIRVSGHDGGRWVALTFRAANGARAEIPSAIGERSSIALRSARRQANAMGGRVVLRRTAGYELGLRLPSAVEAS